MKRGFRPIVRRCHRRRAAGRALCGIVIVAIASFALAALAAAPPADVSKLPPAAARTVDFTVDVQPLFAAACYDCHGQKKQKGDYRLDVKASALAGGSTGGAILRGDGAASPLVHHVAGLDEDMRMPPKGPPLTAEQVGILRAWIDQGAAWPDAPATKPTIEAAHWSLKPLAKPAVPDLAGVKGRAQAKTPIDAFVLSKLSAQGLSLSPPADRRSLIRRLTYDLVGLPPSPGEIDAFLADASTDAYQRVVDRLLASPRYGERQARHWMDVVHYAETHGHDEDVPRPNAWPYRDYLIRSFNDDKPYARFAREQVAGDVLFPDDPQATIATGFLAAGPWDESSMMGIQDETEDKRAARYLDRDDMIAATMSTFVSSTVHCARCHNHKFDPIPQTDYYALQAVFAGVDRIDRPYDADPALHAERRRLMNEKKSLEAGTYPPELLEAAAARVSDWERARATADGGWVMLDVSTFTSAQGSTLTKQPDGSILSGGTRPAKDTYVIAGHVDARPIAAVRLEVLTDPSLPKEGPGRSENGNLHLSEFKVSIAPASKPEAIQSVALTDAAADFDQADWGVAKAIDGKPGTAWGIFPQVGKAHAAVFELKQPVAFDGGAVLTVTLEQLHGGSHLIGRARLSVTSAPKAGRAPVPADIASILATPGAQRDDAQRAALAKHVLGLEVAAKLAALPPPQQVYAVACDWEAKGSYKPAKKPRPVDVLRRGDIRQPIGPAAPGALSCVDGLDARFALASAEDEGARRAALADWIAHPQNGLTWRSIANRVWQSHFGRGIVETASDFGRMGTEPTHAELLDWLAITLRDDGGSLKRLHLLIVTSAVYRQSSAHDAAAARVDVDNRLLWRMNRARLDAEQVRDAALAVSGKLDLTAGGPSVKQFVERKGVHATPDVDYAAFDADGPGAHRRGVYRFVFRTLPDPFLEALDCPDASQLTARRESSVTALQALAMLNDAFMVRQAEHVAARLTREADGHEARIGLLYLLALGRPGEEGEVKTMADHAAKHGLPNACRLMLNCNEFMFVQ